MTKRLIPIFAATALLLLSLAWFAGCGDGADGDGAASDSTAVAADDSTAAAKPKKEKAIKVNAGLVRQGDLVQPVFADGVLRTPKAVEIRSKVGGQLNQVLVRDGDRVRAGQLLARIDPREYAITLEESRYRHILALSQIAAEDEEQIDDSGALADFVAARDALEARRGKLSEEQYRSELLKLELDALKLGAFRQDMFAQRTGLADARIAEQRAQLNLEYTEVRAPFAGVVNGMVAVKGENISVGQVLCSVYDNRKLEAVVDVLEADLGNLAPGRPALIAVPAVGDTIGTSVDVISPLLDEASRTCQVIVRFDNPDDRYRPGMFVRAEIAARIHPEKLMVPREAVLIRDDRPLVFKVTDEPRAQWLYVDTGLENSEWVEILAVHSGGSLAPGEKVVVSDHLTLAHEAKLKIRKTLAPRDRWAAETTE
jgi:RND family efflux transporter MFP subunit